MARILDPARLVAVALTLSLTSVPSFCGASFVVPSPGSIGVALSTLGELLPFRSFAPYTLALVEKDDIVAARAKASIALDTMIDDSLPNPPMPSPKTEERAGSLEALTETIEAVGKARGRA